MAKINWKVRLKNPHFYFQILLSILAPILVYFSLSFEDLTTWDKLFTTIINAAKNPFVVGTVIVSLYNAITDPTTKGIGDSVQALSYDKPKGDKHGK